MTELRLVADSNTESSISSKQDESSTYSVTAIGSCRIVGPLRHLQQSEPMILNQSGVYGYSHSCTEVRKHLTHLLKGTRPPNELLPILSPSAQSANVIDDPHEKSNFYVFELSSTKIIKVDDHPVQLNYLNRYFSTFFANTNRTRAFWALAKTGSHSEMRNFLENIHEYKELTENDQKLLSRIRLEVTTPQQLRLDIDAIRSSVSDHLFVTHFDAYGGDGNLIQSRASYLKMVREALIDCGVTWYDPTESIAAFGQKLALDDPEKSLSHYSPSFEKYLSGNWWHRFIHPTQKERKMDERLRQRIRETAKATPSDLEALLLQT